MLRRGTVDANRKAVVSDVRAGDTGSFQSRINQARACHPDSPTPATWRRRLHKTGTLPMRLPNPVRPGMNRGNPTEPRHEPMPELRTTHLMTLTLLVAGIDRKSTRL